MSNLTNY